MAGDWDPAGWFSRAQMALRATDSHLLLLAAALILLPLVWRLLDGWRWRGVRQKLLVAAAAAHCRCTDSAASVADALLRVDSAPPLQRLTRVRDAIEALQREAARFRQMSAMYAAGLRGRSADVPIDTIDFCEQGEGALRSLVRLYLKEARVRLAPNVVHGEDFLGFETAQLVSIGYGAELDRLGVGFAETAGANATRIVRAMPRRLRRASADDFAKAEAAAEGFRLALARFAQQLQPADPESVEYRQRPGERGVRTLDGMIARFDRGGVLAAAI